jgi:hypothetical protein
MSVIFFMVRISTRTPSPSNVLSVGWWMLLSTTVVSTRIRRPATMLVILRYFHHPMVDLPEHLGPDRHTPSPHGLGIRHLAAAHAGKVAVHEVGAHLAFHSGVAHVSDVLEDQQT